MPADDWPTCEQRLERFGRLLAILREIDLLLGTGSAPVQSTHGQIFVGAHGLLVGARKWKVVELIGASCAHQIQNRDALSHVDVG